MKQTKKSQQIYRSRRQAEPNRISPSFLKAESGRNADVPVFTDNNLSSQKPVEMKKKIKTGISLFDNRETGSSATTKGVRAEPRPDKNIEGEIVQCENCKIVYPLEFKCDTTNQINWLIDRTWNRAIADIENIVDDELNDIPAYVINRLKAKLQELKR